MQRLFEIRNFRNLGLKEPQKLILNSSVNKNELGNVIYIVGPNNSGKSNVLDALEKFGSNQILRSDIPDFDDSDPQPELKFTVYYDKYTYHQKKTLSQQSNSSGFYSNDENVKDVKALELSNESIAFFQSTINFIKSQGHRPAFLSKITYPITPSLSGQVREIFQEMNLFVFSHWGNDFYYTYINGDRNVANKLLNELRDSPKSAVSEAFESKYGYKLIPDIIRFKNTEIKQSQFIVAPADIKNSQFFLSLFDLINYNVDEINNSYAKYKERKTRGTLVTTQTKINNELEQISDQYNKLYLLEQKKYKFEVILDPTQVSFQIYLDELTLNFDSQSTGFKWFFNFYLTLASHKKLSCGDIILMDEPATNLHVKGIEELRDFIHKYAKKSNLVFIISTHSPFFIDTDYLENVRIVNRINNESIIVNKFSFLSNNDIDSLGQIKSALTVSRHILLDPLKKTIFVEGITDYCYLTAFKILYNIKDIAFMPIDGLNDENDVKKLKSDKDLFEAMLKIDKYPTLLVDNDIPGKLAKKRALEKYSGRVEVISIDEFNPEYKEIEDLFDDADKLKKNFDDAVQFKNTLASRKISSKTKDNFKNLLNKLWD